MVHIHCIVKNHNLSAVKIIFSPLENYRIQKCKKNIYKSSHTVCLYYYISCLKCVIYDKSCLSYSSNSINIFTQLKVYIIYCTGQKCPFKYNLNKLYIYSKITDLKAYLAQSFILFFSKTHPPQHIPTNRFPKI